MLSDEFESGQHIDGFYTIVFGNAFAHINGNNGFNHHRVYRHGAMFGALTQNVIEKKHAGLIAGQQLITAIMIPYGNAYTVTVRIGRKKQIGLMLLRIFHSQRHRFLNLRIRIWTGREISIRLFLFLYNSDIGITTFSKNTGYRL